MQLVLPKLQIIPMFHRLWILEKLSLRHRLGDRARPGPDMGNSTGLWTHFFDHPARREVVRPRAGALPETNRLSQTSSEQKVQKLSDFGIRFSLLKNFKSFKMREQKLFWFAKTGCFKMRIPFNS